MTDEISIKIILLSNGPTELEAELQAYENFNVKNVYQIGDFDYKIFKDKTDNETFFIIDQSKANTELVVFTSLFIRNIGGQVFISCPLDLKDLIVTMKDIFFGLRSNPTLRPEIIITEKAFENLGDVAPIVSRFEHEYLN